MDNVLVVVDMQPEFKAAMDEQTQINVVNEIKKAKRRNDLIIILEYRGGGSTVRRIRKAILNYDKVIYAEKDEDDGSSYIRKHLIGKKLVRICGVNTDYCVADTAAGIAYRFADAAVQVILKACNADSHDPLVLLRASISDLPNVDIIPCESDKQPSYYRQ